MDGQVEPHELGEHRVLVANHRREVVGPVFLGVDGTRDGAFAEQVVVDGGGHDGKLRDQVHRVFVGGLSLNKEQFWQSG